MRVSIRRSGGFAGLVEELGSIEVERLPAPEAAMVRAHLAELERWLVANPPEPGADVFLYDVTVVDPPRPVRTLRLADEGASTQPGLDHVLALVAQGAVAPPR